jgi:hypothetical protein
MKEGMPHRLIRRARMTASSAALWSPDKLRYRIDPARAAPLTLPDFLGIGAQKAGTSWLWANLRCHPHLFLPPRKELHYFNLYFYSGLAKYASLFADADGQVRGEITPAYGILPPRTIRFVRQIMPDVKLILILRNPIDRAWSRAKMVLREPGAKDINMDNFSERELRRALVHSSSLARGDYLSIIDNWLQFFPTQQLHICFFDDLVEQPMKFLGGIFEFLGVSTDVDWAQFPFETNPNPTPKTPIPEECKLLLEAMYCAKIEDLYRRLGSRVECWRCRRG